jgi:hypothetical protein
MNGLHDILLQRLINKGLSREMIPGFVRNVTRTVFSRPDITLRELNRRLDWLGWDQIEIDMHTLDLMLADGVLQNLEEMPN